MFDAYTLSDFLYIVFLVATCISCFIAGRIQGASGFAMMLIEYEVIKQEDLEKLRKKLGVDEE